MALEEEWMKLSDEAAPPQPARTFSRRSKLLRLDDLLSANDKEKLEKNKQKDRALESSSDEDEDDNKGKANTELAMFIEKCAAEVGDGRDMKDAPKWGESVFGAQKEVPCFSSSDLEPVRLITAVANSGPERFSPFDENSGNDRLDAVLAGNFPDGYVRDARFRQPEFLHCIFNRLAFSQNEAVRKGACTFLCVYFLEYKDEPPWKPTVDDIREAFSSFGYQDQPDNVDDYERRPPANFRRFMEFLLVLCKLRLFQDSEVEELLPLLARCLFDRNLLKESKLIEDCVEELVNHLPPSSIQKVASSLARLTTDLVNIYHVLKNLRGAPSKVQPLVKETAFVLLSNMTTKKLNGCATDVISCLEDFDPKAGNVNFVEAFFYLNFADLWLHNDPEFKLKPDDEAFTLWMQILRSLAVRIFCGDYRTFANEVRNRAAFLMSYYGMMSSRAHGCD